MERVFAFLASALLIWTTEATIGFCAQHPDRTFNTCDVETDSFNRPALNDACDDSVSSSMSTSTGTECASVYCVCVAATVSPSASPTGPTSVPSATPTSSSKYPTGAPTLSPTRAPTKNGRCTSAVTKVQRSTATCGNDAECTGSPHSLGPSWTCEAYRTPTPAPNLRGDDDGGSLMFVVPVICVVIPLGAFILYLLCRESPATKRRRELGLPKDATEAQCVEVEQRRRRVGLGLAESATEKECRRAESQKRRRNLGLGQNATEAECQHVETCRKYSLDTNLSPEQVASEVRAIKVEQRRQQRKRQEESRAKRQGISERANAKHDAAVKRIEMKHQEERQRHTDHMATMAAGKEEFVKQSRERNQQFVDARNMRAHETKEKSKSDSEARQLKLLVNAIERGDKVVKAGSQNAALLERSGKASLILPETASAVEPSPSEKALRDAAARDPNPKVGWNQVITKRDHSEGGARRKDGGGNGGFSVGGPWQERNRANNDRSDGRGHRVRTEQRYGGGAGQGHDFVKFRGTHLSFDGADVRGKVINLGGDYGYVQRRDDGARLSDAHRFLFFYQTKAMVLGPEVRRVREKSLTVYGYGYAKAKGFVGHGELFYEGVMIPDTGGSGRLGFDFLGNGWARNTNGREDDPTAVYLFKGEVRPSRSCPYYRKATGDVVKDQAAVEGVYFYDRSTRRVYFNGEVVEGGTHKLEDLRGGWAHQVGDDAFYFRGSKVGNSHRLEVLKGGYAVSSGHVLLYGGRECKTSGVVKASQGVHQKLKYELVGGGGELNPYVLARTYEAGDDVPRAERKVFGGATSANASIGKTYYLGKGWLFARNELYQDGVHQGHVRTTPECPYWQALHDAQAKADRNACELSVEAVEAEAASIAAGCGESKMPYILTAQRKLDRQLGGYVRNDHGTFRNGVRIAARSGPDVDAIVARQDENRRKYAAKRIQTAWNERCYDGRAEGKRQKADLTMI